MSRIVESLYDKYYMKNDTPMTYREIYDTVIGDKDYSSVSMFDDGGTFGNNAEVVSQIAQLCYTYGYEEEEEDLTKEDAVWLALELFEDMTGIYYDPTNDEFESIVNTL